MWNISFEQFEKLHSKGLSLDIIYLLLCIKEEYDLSSDSPQVKAIIQKMERKFLVTNGKITVDGTALLSFIGGETEFRLTKKKDREQDFEKWWKAYPGTDTFEYKNKTFAGTRKLRTKENECREKFTKIIAEGEYTVEQLIAALEYEVLQKKDSSYNTGENKLKYMQGSLVYLNQRSYEPFIELIAQNIKLPPTRTNSSNTIGI